MTPKPVCEDTSDFPMPLKMLTFQCFPFNFCLSIQSQHFDGLPTKSRGSKIIPVFEGDTFGTALSQFHREFCHIFVHL